MNDHEHIPDRLARDLKRLHDVEVPASLDERILAEARRRRRPFVQRPMPWLAAAAMVTVGVTTWMLLGPGRAAPTAGDRPVDMVDAFVMAIAVRDDAPTRPAWDLNDDGIVDETDVELAAARSVELPGESS